MKRAFLCWKRRKDIDDDDVVDEEEEKVSARERGPKGRVPRSDWCTLFAGSFLLLVHCERWQWKQLQHPDLMGRPKSKPRRQGRNINVWTSFSSPEENYFNFLTSSKCAADVTWRETTSWRRRRRKQRSEHWLSKRNSWWSRSWSWWSDGRESWLDIDGRIRLKRRGGKK